MLGRWATVYEVAGSNPACGVDVSEFLNHCIHNIINMEFVQGLIWTKYNKVYKTLFSHISHERTKISQVCADNSRLNYLCCLRHYSVFDREVAA